jgi:hypothetical protein
VIPGCQGLSILRLVAILPCQGEQQTLTLLAFIEVSTFTSRQHLIVFDYGYPPGQC